MSVSRYRHDYIKKGIQISMKRMVFAVFLMSLVLICGCNAEKAHVTADSDSENGNSTVEQDTGVQVELVKETGEEIKIERIGAGDAERLGVDKTLVWLLNHITAEVEAPAEKTVNALNDLLVKEYGCDFVVEFQYYPIGMALNFDYAGMVERMMEVGQQVDIIDSGRQNMYSEMVGLGIYEPLKDRLSTEEGVKLWNMYAEEMWEFAKRDGEIYAVYPANDISARIILGCNENMIDKYGITLPEEYSFSDIGAVLEKLEAEGGASVFDEMHPILMYADVNLILELEGYMHSYKLGSGVCLRKDAENNWYALNPVTEKEVLELMKTIREYSDNDWLTWNFKEAEVEELRNGQFLFVIKDVKGVEYADDVLSIEVSGLEIASECVEYKLDLGSIFYRPYGRKNNAMTGIASWSANKEDAFKFLTLLHTEAKLSNCLRLGVEGEDWQYDAEKRAVFNPVSGEEILIAQELAGLSNPNLIPHVSADPEDKIAFCKELCAMYEEDPIEKYNVNVSAYKDKLSTLDEIYWEFMDFFLTAECTDVEAAMKEMAAKFEAVGIDEIIDDINRQIGAK